MKQFVKFFRRGLPKSSETVDSKIELPNITIMEESLKLNDNDPEITILDTTTHPCSSDIKTTQYEIENLKNVVENLKTDIENKEINIAKLAREKEKLNLDVLKLKRSNSNVLKQLENERKFYFQEKEIYCREMTEMKELRKRLSRSCTSLSDKSNQELKNEINNIKQKLKETLEANYNLSIKFLRIKNTKAFLKTEMTKMKIEHEKIFNDLKTKIELLTSEVEDIINHKSHLYASPSNKNYVQLVRQNSSLVHDNLCLQMEIDRLNTQFDKIKLKYTKSETNNRLKYIETLKAEHCLDHSKKDKKRVRITTEDKNIIDDENQEKILKSNLKTNKCQSEIIKIFERCESNDTPNIHILDENDLKKHQKKHRNSKKKHSPKTSNEELKSDSKGDVEKPPHKSRRLKSSIKIADSEIMAAKN